MGKGAQDVSIKTETLSLFQIFGTDINCKDGAAHTTQTWHILEWEVSLNVLSIVSTKGEVPCKAI